MAGLRDGGQRGGRLGDVTERCGLDAGAACWGTADMAGAPSRAHWGRCHRMARQGGEVETGAGRSSRLDRDATMVATRTGRAVRDPRPGALGPGRGAVPQRLVGAGSVKLTVVPRPGSDSAQMRPPCRSTIPRLIASPRPVPPWARESEESTCSKGSKIASSMSVGTPRPGSCTRKTTSAARSSGRAVGRPDRHRGAGGGELHGVAEDVGQRLHDPVRVGQHLARAGQHLEAHLGRRGQPVHLAHRGLHQESRPRRARSSIGSLPERMRSMSRMSLMRRISRSLLGWRC